MAIFNNTKLKKWFRKSNLLLSLVSGNVDVEVGIDE
jgi:hypothetical protein